MSEKFIEFKNVTYTYEPEEQGEAKPSPALCNIDLTVNRGEFVAVLGHNGSGKSTLAKLTNAILVPESGTVTVDGIDTSDEDRLTDIRRKVGMVFQNPDNQIVATIVEDDVAFGPENLGVAPDEIRKESTARSRRSGCTTTACASRISSRAVRNSAWLSPA